MENPEPRSFTAHDEYQLFKAELGKVFTEVGNDVWKEMMDQLTKRWGKREHTPQFWMLIIIEEIGEAAKAILQGDYQGAEEELTQAISCQIQLVRKLRRLDWNIAALGGKDPASDD